MTLLEASIERLRRAQTRHDELLAEWRRSVAELDEARREYLRESSTRVSDGHFDPFQTSEE